MNWGKGGGEGAGSGALARGSCLCRNYGEEGAGMTEEGKRGRERRWTIVASHPPIPAYAGMTEERRRNGRVRVRRFLPAQE